MPVKFSSNNGPLSLFLYCNKNKLKSNTYILKIIFDIYFNISLNIKKKPCEVLMLKICIYKTRNVAKYAPYNKYTGIFCIHLDYNN